ncbi:MAG: DNA-3-methyladenine glycosylase [Myxococcota bacterium]
MTEDAEGFFLPSWECAPLLLGCVIRRGPVQLRIVEVEAYGGPWDSASHARFGRTARTRPLFDEGGALYIYLCYGVHWLVNVVTGPAGSPEAILIRGAEVVSGRSEVGSRIMRDPEVAGALAGPGRVGRALGVDRGQSGARLGCGEWGLWGSTPVLRPVVGPRVGVEYATDEDVGRPWRFADPRSKQVSRRQTLREASIP